MEKLSINTPQNVNIHYPLASVGKRILAIGIDYLLMISYGILMFYFVVSKMEQLEIHDEYLLMGIAMFLMLPVLFYHFFLESLLRGQTLGMRLVKIKVMKVDGSRAGIYEYFTRWAFNIVDIWMLSGVIGMIAIISTKKSQRIGDLAAGTTIIDLKPRLELIQTIYNTFHDNYQIVYQQVIVFTDKDMNEIKRIYDTAIRNNDIDILNKLAERLKKVMKLEQVKSSHEEFIQTVLKDHYYLFKK